MDLPQVKAAVKTWEKSFKAKYKREPTKSDIKDDAGGIAEQYALYRKLSKLSSSSQGQGPSSASTSTSISASQSTGGLARTTPRVIPNSEYPTTPTPPSRRSTYRSRPRPPHDAIHTAEADAEAGPSQPRAASVRTGSSGDVDRQQLKRTASRAEMNPPSSPLASTRTPSTALNTLLTPRKSRPRSPPAYTGPVHDPNPLNPFLASPSKSRTTPFRDKIASSSGPSGSALRGVTNATTRVGDAEMSSPFIHASSPRKLKEVLEANSLRKVRARLEETPKKDGTTPRTRARKRLRGEVVDDTPGKGRVERRRRGGGAGVAEVTEMREGEDGGKVTASQGAGGGEKRAMMSEDMAGSEEDVTEEEREGEDAEMDELGPSPMKHPNGIRSFTSLLGETTTKAGNGKVSQASTMPANRSRPAMFDKSKGKDKITGKDKAESANGDQGSRQPKINGFFGRHSKPELTAEKPSISSATTPRIETLPKPDAEMGDGAASPHQAVLQAASSSDPAERLPTPPTDPDLDNAALSQSSAPHSVQRRRVLRVPANNNAGSISNGEQSRSSEERELVIVPTRRTVRVRRGSSDFGSDCGFGQVTDETAGDAEEGPFDPALSTQAEEESLTPQGTSPDLPPHLLSLLSLRSPTQRSSSSRNKTDLVVRSLFDPDAARQLRALQKGQDVRLSGEELGAGLDDEESEEVLLAKYGNTVGFGSRGVGREATQGEDEEEGDGDGDGAEVGAGGYEDDDWDEEDEGWKRTGEDMDDW